MTIARLIAGRNGAIHSCGTETTVREAIAMLAHRRIGALPVICDDRVVGVFSERDVIYQLAANGPGVLDKPVGEVMTAPPVTIAPETTVLEALGMVTRHRMRHLPVLRDGVMVGFISIGDLVKYRIELIQSEAEALRAYIQAA